MPSTRYAVAERARLVLSAAPVATSHARRARDRLDRRRVDADQPSCDWTT